MIINILREKVMSLVEGISITIAQSNETGVSFEKLWASEDERRKLDIYYREAIGDLERNLMKYLRESHGQFSLTTDGDEGDYTLKVTIRHWPPALEGLLGNKVQDYMVHSVLAGWLNNFSGLEIKSDYASMAGQDLTDIKTIVSQKRFDFDTSERAGDSRESSDKSAEASERTGDSNESTENIRTASERAGDSEESTEYARGVNERTSDRIDTECGIVSSSVRRTDGANKNLIVNHTHVNRRKADAATVCVKHDTVDWSGEGIGDMLMRPHKPNTVITRDPASPVIMPPPHPHIPHHHCPIPEIPPENPNTPDKEEDEVDERTDWEF